MNFQEIINRIKNTKHGEIDLDGIQNETIREKALKIYAEAGRLTTEKGEAPGGDWGTITQMIINFKHQSENPELAELLEKNREINEAAIDAFIIKDGVFPDKFNPKTGKFE